MDKVLEKFGFRKRKTFSLVEVLVAVAVLSFGIVIVCQGFLTALGGYNYALDHLNVLLWMDSKIWEAKDKLTHYRTLLTDDTSGSFMVNNRKFDWNIDYHLIEGSEEMSLYELNLRVIWKEGIRQVSAVKGAYALYVNRD